MMHPRSQGKQNDSVPKTSRSVPLEALAGRTLIQSDIFDLGALFPG